MEKSDNKFDKKLNYDVASEEKISKTNEQLVEYMTQQGETVAAEQIQYLMDSHKDEKKAKPAKNPINDKLLAINTQILGVLESIHEDMFDEQDTSIKKISSVVAPTAVSSGIKFPEQVKKDTVPEQSDGLLNSLLGGLGIGAAKALSKLKNIISPSADSKAKKLAQDKARASMAEEERAKKEADDKRRKAEADEKKKAQDEEKKRKAQDEEKKRKKAEADKKKAEAKARADADTKAKADADAKAKANTNADTKAAKADTKVDNKPKVNDTPKQPKKVEKINTPKPDVKPAKVDAPKAPKVNPKVKPSGILKKVTKFAKVIPILGTAIGAATAIYSAVDGYTHADEILEKPKGDLTETEKLATAAGAVANDFTWGVASTRGTAETILDFIGSEEKDRIIEKYDDKLGIIDYSMPWKSDVDNWHAIENGMSSKEIGEIISIDDWSDDDLERLKAALKAAEQYEKFAEERNQGNIDEAVAYAMQAYRLEQGSLTGQDDMNAKVESSPEIEQKIQDYKTQAEKLSNGTPFSELVKMGIAQENAELAADPFEEDSTDSPAETRGEITDAQKKEMAISSYKFAQSTGNPQYIAAAQKKLDELGIDPDNLDQETTTVEKTSQPGVSKETQPQPQPEQEKPVETTPVEPLNTAKEVKVMQNSENLTNSVKQFEAMQAQMVANVINVSTSINRQNVLSEKPVQERLLNMFSAT